MAHRQREYASKINVLNRNVAAFGKAGEITSLRAVRQSFCANYDKKTRLYQGKEWRLASGVSLGGI